MLEANILGETLYRQRMGAVEATNLLQKVMAEIDVAVFTFDEEDRLSLVNRAGARLLAQPGERLLTRSAKELGLAECLGGEPERTYQKTFPGKTGRWGLRRSSFREGGLPHQMVVLSDLSQALREEERQAWQRLIRVLRHELGNSLAPIKSMASTLSHLLQLDSQPHDWKEDMKRGLDVIADRSESLSRFLEAYGRLARLPQPTLQPVDVGGWIRKVVALTTRLSVEVVPGPEITVLADRDQLEQLLINLLQNAVDASLETGGGVRVGWCLNLEGVGVWIEDDGPGIPETTNLFVPFFTTKATGSGIGLVLSRQIAEAHGGTLTLENRRQGQGCEARLHLPMGSVARTAQ
jgi:signal transduction histidine kinase